MRAPAIAACLLFLGASPASRACADCVDYAAYIHQEGSVALPGDGMGVALAGGYAYVACYDAGLQVVDVTAPGDLRIVAGLPLAGILTGVAVQGSLVCVTGMVYEDRYVGIVHVVDISDPLRPAALGQVRLREGMDAPAAVISGSYAYVAVTDGGLQVVDLSDPRSPRVVGGVIVPGYYISDVAVAGPYAYVPYLVNSSGEGGVWVIDISIPASPWIAAGLAATNGATGIAVAGSVAYLAAGGDGLEVIDISDPRDPCLVGRVAEYQADRVTLSPTHAYVWSYVDLVVMDLTTPKNPRFVAGVVGAGGFTAVRDGIAFTTGGDSDNGGGILQALDVTYPENPPMGILQLHCTSPWPRGVAATGGYAYVAQGDDGFQVVNIADRLHPVSVGFLGTHSYGVAVAGTHGFLAGSDALVVLDLADPAHPRVLGSAPVDRPFRVEVEGGYAYVVGWGGFAIVSVANPSHPQVVGTLPAPGLDVAVAGGYAYLGSVDTGLQVVDVRDPYHPLLVGGLETGYAVSVAAVGRTACIADGRGLEIVDISDPLHPVLTANFQPLGDAVAVSGQFAYFGGGFEVIDVSDPQNPRMVGCDFATSVRPFDAAVSDAGVCYVSSDYLMIAPTQCEAAGITATDPVEGLRGLQVEPNPARGSTVIRLALADRCGVVASLHDVAGRRIRSWDLGVLGAGVHEIPWNGCDEVGRPMPDGVYLTRVSTGAGTRVARVILVK